MANVYAKTDGQDRVLVIESDVFLENTEGWILVDSGEGDKYVHARGNYLDESLYEEDGIPRYKLNSKGRVVSRTAKEIQSDIDALPEPTADPVLRRLEEQEQAILELAEIIAGGGL